jgi:hypothetical protein
MRFYLASILVFAACGAEVREPDEADSVRERLALGSTLFEVDTTESAGAVTASRKTSDGWVPGLADLRIDAGELVVSADRDGTLALEELRLDIGPLAVPETVLGYPLELTDIHLSLIDPVKMVGEWSSDDEGRGNASIDLKLEWSLTNHGTTSPLGSPDLPLVPVEIELTGNGQNVHAEVRVSAPGELWKWANVFLLEDLTLVIKSDTQP